MARNIANIYKQNSIQTASPAALTLMLYEGAIRFGNQALEYMEAGNIEQTNEYIKKTQNIIVEFRSTLDFKYPVAKDFDDVYDYIYRRLVESNMKKDKEILEEAVRYIKEMRDTWKEVMRLKNVK